MEKIALDEFRKLKEEEQALLKEEERKQEEQEAFEIFTMLDSNMDKK